MLCNKKSKKKTHKRTSSAEPLRCDSVMPMNEFVLKLKRLSNLCGINPGTVEKKIPSTRPQDVVEATLKKFREAEALCEETNATLLGAPMSVLLPKMGDGVDSLTDLIGYCDSNVFDWKTACFINSVVRELNNIVSIDYKVDTSFYFGPGAASIFDRSSQELARKIDTREYGVPNVRFNPFDFFSSEAIIPRPFDKDSDTRYDCMSSLAYHLSEATIGCHIIDDRICQVPKNKDVNRTIGVGSVVGIGAQHVVGAYIRKCLRKHGLDLNRLAECHKEEARQGSLGAEMATFDFSMASDTLSVGLCWVLLANTHSSKKCKKLFSLLMSCRSDYYVYDQGIPDDLPHIYEKISAMGNSFTFELESLIFTAIARAYGTLLLHKEFCTGQYHMSWHDFKQYWYDSKCGTIEIPRGSSFGDDMIVVAPRRQLVKYQHAFDNILHMFGLQLNTEKSFYGYESFRESCGADYDNGRFVRGFYLHTNSVYIKDVIRAWNFFKLFHDVPDVILESPAFFGGVIKKYRLFRVAVDLYNGCIRPAYAHEMRVPQDVLLCETHVGKYLFNELLPAKQKLHEIGTLHMYFLPSDVKVDRDWRSTITSRLKYEDDDVHGYSTSAVRPLDERINTLMGISPQLTYFRVNNRYHLGIDRCMKVRSAQPKCRDFQYPDVIDLKSY